MNSLLRITSRFIAAAGLLGTAAAFLLAHLAQTRMGVMRDLYVRNEPFMTVLNSPVAHWTLRLLVIGCALFLIRSLFRSLPAALLGIAAVAFWLVVSFTPSLLGLATPWMLMSLAILIVGCMGMLISRRQ